MKLKPRQVESARVVTRNSIVEIRLRGGRCGGRKAESGRRKHRKKERFKEKEREREKKRERERG